MGEGKEETSWALFPRRQTQTSRYIPLKESDGIIRIVGEPFPSAWEEDELDVHGWACGVLAGGADLWGRLGKWRAAGIEPTSLSKSSIKGRFQPDFPDEGGAP